MIGRNSEFLMEIWCFDQSQIPTHELELAESAELEHGTKCPRLTKQDGRPENKQTFFLISFDTGIGMR